jgi:hypothetical protein
VFLDKIKRKSDGVKKREKVYFLTKTPSDFTRITESLSLYGVEVINNYLNVGELLDTVNDIPGSKTYFVIDGAAYSESETIEIAKILRGRYPAMLIGFEDSIGAVCTARDNGFSNYFVRNNEIKYLISEIVKYFGYERSRTSLVVGLCNTSPDAEVSYRTFNDLLSSKTMKGYSALFINCDISNIYYDATLGVKANEKATALALNIDSEIDTESSLKLISHIREQLDYLSFNVMADNVKMNDANYLLQRISNIVDSVSNAYGFIFLNLPYYLIAFPVALSMLKNSDIRVLMTNGRIESVYNINYLKNSISFKNERESKKRDKLISIRPTNTSKVLSVNNITDSEIVQKLQIEIDYSSGSKLPEKLASLFNKSKESENIIDCIIR